VVNLPIGSMLIMGIEFTIGRDCENATAQFGRIRLNDVCERRGRMSGVESGGGVMSGGCTS